MGCRCKHGAVSHCSSLSSGLLLQDQLSQFSIDRSGTCSNARRLRVTAVLDTSLWEFDMVINTPHYTH
jgi:hypothetical protein